MGTRAPGYDRRFYESVLAGSVESARVVWPILDRLLPVSLLNATLLDVGCGNGAWASEAQRQFAMQVSGIDGPWAENNGTPLIEDVTYQDFVSDPIDAPRHDVVVSLEVAEHLPKERAAGFIADLCRCSAGPVIFSAAIPKQGGVGHINEQYPDYWAEIFFRHGFGLRVDPRMEMWDDDRIEPWYQQNLLVYERDLPYQKPKRLVHSEVWEAKWPRM